jgi:cytochrome b subunit of formate dehydrogenase
MICHADQDLTGLTKDDQEISMYVEEAGYKNSIHSGLDCIDCHSDLDGMQDYPHDENLINVNCGTCHEDAQQEYGESLHGLKFINRVELAPKCSDCHGVHNILSISNPESQTYFQNLPSTCCSCHESRGKQIRSEFKQPCVREEYLRGVHGKMVAEGLDFAPTCNTCHPAHSIRKRIDPQSTISKRNIGNTCGQCHLEELAKYSESIHASALYHGVLESATCTDCHGEHQILHPDSALFVADHDACIGCHNDEKVVKKYNLQKTVVSTYVDSYHGLSIKLGEKDAATCGSCHGNHDIHPSDHQHSSTHEDHVVETCSKCHENSTESFAESYTHEAMLIRGNPINFYITLIYVILIVGVIGAMFGHNLIIFAKYIGKKRGAEKDYYIIRFKRAEILQHAALMISFTVLAISGFALKFPDAWWVEIFSWMGINEWGRRLIHRGAAVVMVVFCFYHLYYIFLTKRGRYLLGQIMIRFADISEIIQTMKYYLGLSKTKPEYEEFDYTEKAEYWSLVWGNIVMALTGVVLWFPALFTSFAPSWIVRASELIHYYEAILATLAIIIFHLFFVIVHPEQYPMNLSWLTGKMSLQAAIHKHPLWIKRILKERINLELLPEVIQANCQSIDDIEKYLKFGNLYPEIEQVKVN